MHGQTISVASAKWRGLPWTIKGLTTSLDAWVGSSRGAPRSRPPVAALPRPSSPPSGWRTPRLRRSAFRTTAWYEGENALGLGTVAAGGEGRKRSSVGPATPARGTAAAAKPEPPARMTPTAARSTHAIPALGAWKPSRAGEAEPRSGGSLLNELSRSRSGPRPPRLRVARKRPGFIGPPHGPMGHGGRSAGLDRAGRGRRNATDIVPTWTPANPKAATPAALPIPPSAVRGGLSLHLVAKSQHLRHLSAIRCLDLSSQFHVFVWADPPVATAAWHAADTE
jgi:hypothetical protein